MRAEHMFVRCNCIRIKDEILRVFFFFFFLCFFFFFFFFFSTDRSKAIAFFLSVCFSGYIRDVCFVTVWSFFPLVPLEGCVKWLYHCLGIFSYIF